MTIEEMNTEFTIKCKMNSRWVGPFLSMLRTMECYGEIGHSEIVGLYSDGDGDFRPKFSFDEDLKDTKYDFYPYPDVLIQKGESIFDADYHVDKEQFETQRKEIKE